jgi:hypothetical protein
MSRDERTLRSTLLVGVLSLSAVMTAVCGTLVGAGVGAATDNDVGKSARIGAGIGAAGGAM